MLASFSCESTVRNQACSYTVDLTCCRCSLHAALDHQNTDLKIRQDGPPQGGHPQNPKIRKKPQKTKVFWSKTRFLASPGRDLSNRGGIFRFGALRGTAKFRYIFRQFFAKIPIPIQAFASCGAGSHAFLWTGQVPELRIYVVGAAGGPSFGPKSQFSSFSGGPGKTHHPALC